MNGPAQDTRTAAGLAALFDPPVRFGLADPRAPAAPLYPQEARAVASARRARRREFAAGRTAARAALAALDLPPQPIPMAPDRAPVWPAGITGSISHTDTHCVAVVSNAPGLRGLGIDMEPSLPLERALWPEICTMGELDALLQHPAATRGLLARALFCAKEAAFKAQYPVSRTVFGFQTLELTMREQGFTARFTHAVPGFAEGAELHGRLALLDGVLCAGVTL
ncbi:MAG: 4'-phosphopantetheinyl transferase superfamily protein [Rhodobacteraceae bacterium]|nr:4'-phosphopantetheinyl transferase superfamily protein [Paracoccaceae bacterium]